MIPRHWPLARYDLVIAPSPADIGKSRAFPYIGSRIVTIATERPSLMLVSRTPVRLASLALAASLLALAACSEEEETSANALVQQTAQAETGADASGQAGAAGGGEAAAPDAETSAASNLGEGVEAPAPSGSVDMAELLDTQPLPDIVIGDPDAPVTIVEYASMTCSHCADFHENSYPQIKEAFIDSGQAKLIVREFPFDPRALAAFALARCMPDDAKRTAMIDVLFDQQASWARGENASAELLRIAKLAGMSQEDFEACLNNEELQKQIVAVQQAGQTQFGVEATPTFFVNGDKYSGALSTEQMGAVIRSKL